MMTMSQDAQQVMTNCCPDPKECNDGVPSTCSFACSGIFMDFWEECGSMVALSAQGPAMSNFYDQCQDTAAGAKGPAVSIHGGKDQDERNEAIAQFKDTSKDVLVATDIAAKGLDFPDIQHVINFDMPAEIENYVVSCM